MWTTTYDARVGLTDRSTRTVTPTTGSARLPLGLCAGGQVEWWDTAEQASLLVADSTGYGAAVFLASIAAGACRSDWSLRIGEPRAGELSGLEAWPNVDMAASSPAGVADLLAEALDEVDRRVERVDDGREAATGSRQLLLINLYDLVDDLEQHLTRPVAALLSDLALDGPAVGLHLACAAKRSLIDPSLRDCFDVQVWTGSPPPPAPLSWNDDDLAPEAAATLYPFWQGLPAAEVVTAMRPPSSPHGGTM